MSSGIHTIKYFKSQGDFHGNLCVERCLAVLHDIDAVYDCLDWGIFQQHVARNYIFHHLIAVVNLISADEPTSPQRQP